MKPLIRSICWMVGGLFWAPIASAWDQVIDFNEFEPGVYAGFEGAISDLVQIVRDEGYERHHEQGFARHWLEDDTVGGLMYSLSTGGYGYSWGHVFGAIVLDDEITAEGTLYFQFAMEGISQDVNIGLAEAVPVEWDPADPWPFWDTSQLGNWGAFKFTIRNHTGKIGIRDDTAYRHGALEWVPHVWYEIWITVDMAAQRFSVYLRAPGAGIPEQTVFEVFADDEWHSEFAFRSSAEALRTIQIGMVAGNPGAPTLGHRWWINNIAIDYASRNPGDPPVPAPGDPPGYEPPVSDPCVFEPVESEYGLFNAYGFLGRELFLSFAPYAYSRDIDTWLFIPLLWKTAGDEPRRDSCLPMVRATWVYAWGAGFPTDDWHFSPEFGTWVYAHESRWVWVYNSRRDEP